MCLFYNECIGIKDLPKGTILNCILRYESRDGMTRIIDLLTPDNEPVRVDGLKHPIVHKPGNGYEMDGMGEDKAWRLVADLGTYLHNDDKWFEYRLL